MKNRKIGVVLAALLALAATGCGAKQKDITMNVPAALVVEEGMSVRFAPMTNKAENVSGYKITVTSPSGAETAYTDTEFTTQGAGNYIIRYDALNGEKTVVSKSTLLTVLPAQAPVITVKQNTANMIWSSGKTYALPDVALWDNLDETLSYDVQVTDSQQRNLAVQAGKITVLSKGIHTLSYKSTDTAGHTGEKILYIYATEANEISSFEVEQLMNRFSVEGNCEISYNTDKTYTYASSDGSLKAHFEKAEKNTYPGVLLSGNNMPYKDLYATDYDGIRFKVYLTGNVKDISKQDIWVSFGNTDGVQARVKLNRVENFGMNRWLEFTMTKEELKGISEFGEKPLEYVKLWTILTGEEETLDMYVDNVEYLKK